MAGTVQSILEIVKKSGQKDKSNTKLELTLGSKNYRRRKHLEIFVQGYRYIFQIKK